MNNYTFVSCAEESYVSNTSCFDLRVVSDSTIEQTSVSGITFAAREPLSAFLALLEHTRAASRLSSEYANELARLPGPLK